MERSGDNFITRMAGSGAAPPRRNGELSFGAPWEERAFGIAVALCQLGHYRWEDFRQRLIASIAEWEAEHGRAAPGWNYYDRWRLALERLLLASRLLDERTLEARTGEFLTAASPTSTVRAARRAILEHPCRVNL